MARKIAVLVFLFVACYMGAHYFIRWRNTVTDDVTKIGRLVECEPNEAREIRIRQSEGAHDDELVFLRQDQPAAGVPAVSAVARWEWKESGAVTGAADPALIRRLVSTVCELYDPVPVRDTEFKTSPSSMRVARFVRVSFAGGRTAEFEFGVKADRATVIRYRGNGKERFVRIPDRFHDVAAQPPEKFRNLRVTRTEADDVQVASLSIEGKERFTLEREGADWNVLQGGKPAGKGADEATRFVNRVSTLQGLSVEKEDFSGTDCAAMKARAVVSFRDVMGKEETVRFDYARGDVSACSTAGTQKFRVHKDMIPYLDVPLKRVMTGQTSR